MGVSGHRADACCLGAVQRQGRAQGTAHKQAAGQRGLHLPVQVFCGAAAAERMVQLEVDELEVGSRLPAEGQGEAQGGGRRGEASALAEEGCQWCRWTRDSAYSGGRVQAGRPTAGGHLPVSRQMRREAGLAGLGPAIVSRRLEKAALAAGAGPAMVMQRLEESGVEGGEGLAGAVVPAARLKAARGLLA